MEAYTNDITLYNNGCSYNCVQPLYSYGILDNHKIRD